MTHGGAVTASSILGISLRRTLLSQRPRFLGWDAEANPQHVDTLVYRRGLEDANPMDSPGSETTGVFPGSEDALSTQEGGRYCQDSGLLQHIAVFRFDVRYAAKECTRALSKPTKG